MDSTESTDRASLSGLRERTSEDRPRAPSTQSSQPLSGSLLPQNPAIVQSRTSFLGFPAEKSHDSCSARDVPLPESSSTRYSSSQISPNQSESRIDVSSLQRNNSNPRIIPQQSGSPYISHIAALSQFLSHLRHSWKCPRYRHKYDISIYDFQDNHLVGEATRSYKTDGRLSGLGDLLIKDIPSTLTLRFVLVEDLSEDVIEQLGSTFGVSPEFFEEHLINSSWQGGSDEDQESDTWRTHGLSKDYASIRWHRPVVPCYTGLSSTEIRTNSTAIRATSPQARHLFSVHEGAEGSVELVPSEWSEEVEVRKADGRNENVQVQHRVSPLTNIQRCEWKLSTNRKEDESEEPSLTEERASVWSSKDGHCRVGECQFGLPWSY